MTRTAKKITSLFFILLGFSPLLFVLVMTIKKHEVRQRMREELGKKELQVVIIPEMDVVWMDKHEIWVNNSMFDIASKKLEHGVYTFTGLYDEDETELVNRSKKEAGDPAEKNKLLTQLFKTLPIFCEQKDDNLNPIIINDDCRSLQHSRLVDPFREILTPPPRS